MIYNLFKTNLFIFRKMFLILLLKSMLFPTFVFGDTRPERIVSISPSLTEILFAIGSGSQVVAVDNYSNYPPEVPTTSLSAYEPNMEAIASFDPDLVILSYDIGDLVKGLNSIGIETMLLPAAEDFEGILSQVKDLGLRTGNNDQAHELARKMKSEMEDLINKMANRESIRVYHEIDENYYSASSNSFIGSIYGLLNFTNIADKADEDGYGYPKLSPEYILSSNPELIILPGKDAEYVEKLKKRPGWSAIDAVKKENFLLLDPDIGSRWGPRVIDFAKSVVNQASMN